MFTRLNKHESERQCMAVSDIYRQTLGDGPDKNYRLECEYQEAEK